MVRTPVTGGTSTRAVPLAVMIVCAATLTACGTPPEVRREVTDVEPPAPTVSPTTAPPTMSPATPPTRSAAPGLTTPGFPEATAVDCAGQPAAAEVIASLRRSSALLGAGVPARVITGPLCAGDWQWSVLEVPDREPLQVVSTGTGGDLVLVTAGTDVCNARVRVAAPAGIRLIACEGGQAPASGT